MKISLTIYLSMLIKHYIEKVRNCLFSCNLDVYFELFGNMCFYCMNILPVLSIYFLHIVILILVVEMLVSKL